MKFELNVQENWKNMKIQEIEEMISKSVFCTDVSGDLKSNFDPNFYTFLKENERLAKMDIMVKSASY